jgi:hypothetical protein
MFTATISTNMIAEVVAVLHFQPVAPRIAATQTRRRTTSPIIR